MWLVALRACLAVTSLTGQSNSEVALGQALRQVFLEQQQNLSAQRASDVYEVGIGLAKLGQTDLAHQAVMELTGQPLPGDANVDELYTETAKAEGRRGDIAQALATVAELRNASWRQRALGEVGVELAQAGRTGDALRINEQLEGLWRVRVLEAVATSEFSAGHRDHSMQYIEKAKEAAATIGDTWDRGTALWEIANVQAVLGDVPGEQDTLARVVDQAIAASGDYITCRLLWKAAVAQSLAGERDAALSSFEKAVDVARAFKPSMVSESNSRSSLRDIAVAQARAGFLKDALATAELIGQKQGGAPWDKDDALQQIGRIQVGNKDFEDALGLCAKIETESTSSALLVVIAEGQAQAGEVQAAFRTAELPKIASRKAEAKLRIAAVMARQGDREGALAVARDIAKQDINLRSAGFDWESPASWGEHYEWSAMLGGSVATITWAERIAADLAGAAMSLAVLVEPRGPREYAKAFEGFDDFVLRRMALEHTEAVNPQEALQWCMLLKDPHARAQAVLGVVDSALKRSN
jgi:tetratricopeptide (TPR) repeat protein